MRYPYYFLDSESMICKKGVGDENAYSFNWWFTVLKQNKTLTEFNRLEFSDSRKFIYVCSLTVYYKGSMKCPPTLLDGLIFHYLVTK